MLLYPTKAHTATRRPGRHKLRTICSWLPLLLLALARYAPGGEPLRDPWLRQVEVGFEPEIEGQRIVNVRLRPSRSDHLDLLVFECVLRQEILTLDTAVGKERIVINEPIRFTHRRRDVNLVDDLDWHGAFRVPIGEKRLNDIYGNNTFSPAAPIGIDRMTIRAEVGGKTLWERTFQTPGRYEPVEPERSAAKRNQPGAARFGDIDLDGDLP